MGAITATTPVGFSDPLPAEVDVAIVGGGVAGVSAAWFLAERGLRVAVLEKGRVAGEQSSRNWGWVRQQGRDAAELPIMTEALTVWDRMGEITGEDTGFRREGVLYIAATEADMAGFERWYGIARAHQLDTRLLTAAEVRGLVDTPGERWTGGIVTPSDGRAEPWLAVPAFARAARRAGVAVTEDCAVRSLDIEGGRVAGVVTENGRIRAGRVLVAAGAWSRLLLQRHGVDLPQLAVRATVAATAPCAEVFAGNAADDRLAFRRRADGGYTLALCDFHEHFIGRDTLARMRTFWPCFMASRESSAIRPAAPSGFPDAWGTPRNWSEDAPSPFEKMRVLDPAPNAGAVKRIERRMGEILPKLKGTPIAKAWAGMIDTTPDVVPVLDEVAAVPGLWIATGFSGHGFGIGPGAGRVMADLMTGRAPGHDVSRFRFSRFSDGSKLELGPAL